MRNNDFDSDENEAPLKSVRTSRREHRSRRIDVMRELESGVVDERPIKERFSREFKKAKIKRIKNPVENIGEENCVEGLVLEVHRRTCEVRLDEKEVPSPYADHAHISAKALSDQRAQGGHDKSGILLL